MSKIERNLVLLLFILMPFQARKILFGLDWTFNEWVSFSVYLTDVLLFGLVAYWILKGGWKSLRASNKRDYLLLSFILYCALTIFWSLNREVSVFYLIRIIEFSIFFLYISKYVFKKIELSLIAKALVIGGAIQSVIGLIQYLIQRDIGLRILGESVIGPYISGTAAFILENGDKVIRGYGLTPHSNIYSAYILLSISALLWLASRKKTDWFLYIAPLLVFGIGVGYSRTILLLFGIIFLIFSIKSVKEINIRKPLLVIFISGLLFISWQFSEIKSRVLISGDDEAVTMRGFYNKEAISGGPEWLGVGIGNFVPWSIIQVPSLPNNLYQPVHNVFLLLYKEIGLVGLSLFILFIISLFIHSNNWYFKTFFIFIVFLMLFDHYLLTLQQGRFIFWFALVLLTHRE